MELAPLFADVFEVGEGPVASLAPATVPGWGWRWGQPLAVWRASSG